MPDDNDDYLIRLAREQERFQSEQSGANFKQPRVYDDKYLAHVRTLACCVCGDNTSVEAHHPRIASVDDGKRYTGLGEKASDRWAVPLCSRHHRILHQGNEREFWASVGINPFAYAMTIRMPDDGHH